MPTLYQQILQERFDALDAGVKRLHRLQGRHRLCGRCSIVGSESIVGKLIGMLMRLPKQVDDVAFGFELDATSNEETWIRRFPHRSMRSTLRREKNGLLSERIGPAQLQFSLDVKDGHLSMRLEAIRIFGMRWPRRWFPQVWATELGIGNRFHFDVGARFQRLGLLVAYAGFLELPSEEQAA